jgi:hypothetical protein
MKRLGKGKQKESSINVEDNPGRSREQITGSSKNIKYTQGSLKGKSKFSSSGKVSKTKELKIITSSDEQEETRGRSSERKRKDARGRSSERKRKNVRSRSRERKRKNVRSRSRDFATFVLQDQSERVQSKKRHPESRKNRFNRKSKDNRSLSSLSSSSSSSSSSQSHSPKASYVSYEDMDKELRNALRVINFSDSLNCC